MLTTLRITSRSPIVRFAGLFSPYCTGGLPTLLDHKLPPGDVKTCVRCVAGKGIKGLRWSVERTEQQLNELRNEGWELRRLPGTRRWRFH